MQQPLCSSVILIVSSFMVLQHFTMSRAGSQLVAADGYEQQQQQVVELRWYSHDTPFSGPSSSSQPVTAFNASNFQNELKNFRRGQIYVFDDLLTLGSSSQSSAFGRAQGTYTFTSGQEVAAYVSYTVRIEAGQYNGSTLTILGVGSESGSSKTYTIVGGTEKFALARGILEQSVVDLFGDFSLSSTVAQHATIFLYQ